MAGSTVIPQIPRTKETEMTTRQKYLLVACVEAELEINRQCDTGLAIAECDDKDDPSAALASLRQELKEIITLLEAN